MASVLANCPVRALQRSAPAPITLPRGNTPCCLPIGEPSRPSFHFCGADNVVGKPYYPEHCDLAYRKNRRFDERDDLVSNDVTALHLARIRDKEA